MVKLFEKYEFPEGLYYSKDHFWVKVEEGKTRVGLTDFAQQVAGEILIVRPRLPKSRVEHGGPLGTMETGKWTGVLKSPLSGTIIENNRALRKASLVNEDPYGEGWISIIQPTNLDEELKTLMTEANEIKPWLEQEIVKIEKEKKK